MRLILILATAVTLTGCGSMRAMLNPGAAEATIAAAQAQVDAWAGVETRLTASMSQGSEATTAAIASMSGELAALGADPDADPVQLIAEVIKKGKAADGLLQEAAAQSRKADGMSGIISSGLELGGLAGIPGMGVLAAFWNRSRRRRVAGDEQFDGLVGSITEGDLVNALPEENRKRIRASMRRVPGLKERVTSTRESQARDKASGEAVK